VSQLVRLERRLVTRPLRLDFATSRGRKSALTSTIVRAELASGAAGVGEIPTSALFPDDTPARSAELVARARAVLRGVPIAEREPILGGLRRELPGLPMSHAGLEVALHRAWLAEEQLDERGWWGGRLHELETDLTVPFLPDQPEAVEAWIRRGVGGGFRCFKLKVGGEPAIDLAHVVRLHALLRAALGVAPRLRLDGNQGYTVARYARMLRGLERARIEVELFEQPLRAGDLASLRRLRADPACRAVPLYLDEDVLDAERCARLASERLCDGVNLKVAKSGVAESARILEVAREAGLGLMIGCMTETMVGLSAGLAVAAGTGAFDAVDLDGVHFLRRLPRWPGIRIDGARYRFAP
jgi:L-alanine-DL-glutamate epimerase-like enolase superfamily enzyme